MENILVIEEQDLMRSALSAEFKSIFCNCRIFGAQSLCVATELLSKISFDLIAMEPGMSEARRASAAARLAMISNIVALSPKSSHLVATSEDSHSEAENCKKLGVLGYAAKVGLRRDTLEHILLAIEKREFIAHLSSTVLFTPDIYYASLTPREQEIVNLMIARNPGVKRKDVYEEMGNRCGINVCSAEKYFKQARAKLQQLGPLPKDL
ncbi:DNA-binding response regulator [Agrobacterium rosae]|jgi:DNA-binding NarL/FixJ family response regulator|uniref:DNA-binding response regulator n=1 Tax=Agrobacterium rosae TaxID=1972867 RepID=UPI003A8086F4